MTKEQLERIAELVGDGNFKAAAALKKEMEEEEKQQKEKQKQQKERAARLASIHAKHSADAVLSRNADMYHHEKAITKMENLRDKLSEHLALFDLESFRDVVEFRDLVRAMIDPEDKPIRKIKARSRGTRTTSPQVKFNGVNVTTSAICAYAKTMGKSVEWCAEQAEKIGKAVTSIPRYMRENSATNSVAPMEQGDVSKFEIALNDAIVAAK